MTAFQPVAGCDGVLTAQAGRLRCTALRLRDGSLCLYSPVAGLEAPLLAQIGKLGPVSALLAPNHYHNKGLAAHVAAFPDAMLYGSAAATPRLTRITGLTFRPLDGLRAALADGQSLHEPAGLKTGEVWVSAGPALVVTDAFSAAHRAPGQTNDRVTMLGTFPRYGIADVSAYQTWAKDMLRAAAPTTLLPCHGAPVHAADLVPQLIAHLGALA